jgi:hypothetical protein
MKKSIKLKEVDWGQVIDGLECRARQYERTAVQFDEHGCYDEGLEEVSSADEARNLARWYRQIIQQIRRQLHDD